MCITDESRAGMNEVAADESQFAQCAVAGVFAVAHPRGVPPVFLHAQALELLSLTNICEFGIACNKIQPLEGVAVVRQA
jgi:hypothetical protein